MATAAIELELLRLDDLLSEDFVKVLRMLLKRDGMVGGRRGVARIWLPETELFTNWMHND